ncbi:DUF4381 domain-containing protein [Sediminitomix flava]|uniref:Uncharacterized protein DUF4381 n=1 Tax=Sediminitomix flava TaxID=379075 RepID=A0A315ZHR5_SEDFL|nr:DUF4381 domain-containing protein [Sediminitomix flava]PWJ44254.1 uncharacterized protein DUF4381 [Sediminitomix flava]
MNENENSIGQLIEPGPIAYTYDTTGWKIVAATLVFLFVLFILWKIYRYLKNTYRREALQYFSTIENTDINLQKQVLEVNKLLKQVAITAYGRQKVISLQKEKWIDFLNSKSKKAIFSDSTEEVLNQYIYKSALSTQEVEQTKQYLDHARTWISKHEL